MANRRRTKKPRSKKIKILEKVANKIAIIVGINDDECMNYKFYPELKNIPEEIQELSEKNGKPASDVSIAYLLQKRNPKKQVDIFI